MKGRSTPLVLRDPEQLGAIRSPVAHQVISVMERLRRATVAELSARTGVPAGSLYYHVRKLERAGVLAPVEKRSTGGRDEVVYQLMGSEVVLDPLARDARFLNELARVVRTRLRALERLLLAALESASCVRSGRGRNFSVHQHQSRLSARKRHELYRRIEELERFLVENDDPSLEVFTHVTLAVSPVVKE